MPRLIPLSIVSALIVLAGLTTGLSIAQSSASTNSVTMALSCSSKVGSEPTTYVLFCADANAMLSSLKWTDWGAATAYATGVAKWNDCTPTCAAGTWKHQPVTVWAWRNENGKYTRLSSSDPKLLSTITLSTYPG
ncbi:MAG TPA: hypothetical protein VMV11_00230 [Acidimicrobiales bacterium]|nr:hypothetical protein [Acidimicrobiales bacterium]